MTDERYAARRPGVETGVRTAAIWSLLQTHTQAAADRAGRPLRVLDLGGGSGGLAVPLAVAGHEVLVVDPSPDALASLRRRAAETSAAERVRAAQGDADSLPDLVGPGTMDLVICHETLEHVDDPATTLARLAEVLAPDGALSVVVAQRYAAVLARALAGAIDAALLALASEDGRWGEADPLPRRFDRQHLLDLLTAAGLTPEHVHGVRIFTDLVPASALDSDAERQLLFALDQAAAGHRALADLAMSLHVLARRG